MGGRPLTIDLYRDVDPVPEFFRVLKNKSIFIWQSGINELSLQYQIKIYEMNIDDWVLFPMTKDDRDNPTIVARILSIEKNIVYVSINNEPVPIPKNWCRVVHIQK